MKVFHYSSTQLLLMLLSLCYSCSRNMIPVVECRASGGTPSSLPSRWARQLGPRSNGNNNNNNNDKSYSYSSPNNTNNNNNRLSTTFGIPLSTNPFDDVDPRERSWQENIIPTITSLATISYGTALTIHGLQGAKTQLRCLTMFRATGHEKLVHAVQVAKQNVKDAAFTALWRTPSFLKAHRSITKLDDQIAAQRQAIAKAKADGSITKREEKRLKAQKKKYIRQLQRDMRRMAAASANVQDIVKALDFDELKDLSKAFLSQLLAVLSAGEEADGGGDTVESGKQTGRMGMLVGKWCLFLNLSSLVSEATLKCSAPFCNVLLPDDKIEVANNAGKALTFATSGFLVVKRNIVARRLNAAFLSSAVVLRGLRDFVQTMLDWDDDDDDGPWPLIALALDGFAGGVLLVSLSVAAWKSHAKRREEAAAGAGVVVDGESGEIQVVEDGDGGKNWQEAIVYKTRIPLLKLESALDTIVDEMEKFV